MIVSFLGEKPKAKSAIDKIYSNIYNQIMKSTKNKNYPKIQAILLFIVSGLIIIIILGTVIGLNKKKNQTAEKNKSLSEIRGNKNLYSDIGRLRIATSDKEQCTIVIFPVLEYNGKDKPFEEELVQKKERLRQIILHWFSNYKKYEIYSMDENKIKIELLEAINLNLDLSKVKKIYFKEFIILE